MIKKLLGTLSALVVVSGCNTAPKISEPWAAVNTVDSIDVSRRTFNSSYREVPAPAPAHLRADVIPEKPDVVPANPNQTISISLEKAMDQYIPPAYHIDIEPDVNLQSIISVDASKNWLEALGQGMSDANIEFIANLYRKSATIKRTKVTLGQAIDLLLPNDYTVFTAAGVSLQTLIHFDTRRYWVEALSNGAADTGIDLTINFTNKVIALKRIEQASQKSTINNP